MRSVRKWIGPSVAALTGVAAGAAIESKRPFFVDVVEFSKRYFEPREPVPANPIPPTESSPAAPVTPLPLLTDALFDKTDNMLVFMFASQEMFAQQSDRVHAIASQFLSAQKNHPSLASVKLFYSIVPPAHAGSVVDTSRVELMSYKGQRKLRTSLGESDDVPMGSLAEFFQFKSTPVDEELKECLSVQHISADEFGVEVLEKARPGEIPILVQLYEKSCFLCFLMRPFLNSLAELVKDKVIIKRLDIEENDFPEGVPVVRGTPTFVQYPGGTRFEEFKPRDLVNRLCRDYQFDEETKKEMMKLVDQVATRFQMFSGLVMWQTESEKILDLLANKSYSPATLPFSATNSDEADKAIFNKIVAEFMADDMLRVDGMASNLKTLTKELNSAEVHALSMAQTLGEKVRKLEGEEQLVADRV
jgi:thiol-disulfide isomerase/thioredoxin